MKTPIRLAVFDVAGTTVLDGDAVVDCLRTALQDHHVDVARQDIVDVMGWPKPAAIRHLLGTHGSWSDGELAAATDRIHDDFRTTITARYRDGEGVSQAAGASDVFSALRRRGVKVVLDTGFSREILDVLLSRLDWQPGATIDLSVASDEVERGRPHPDLIQRAMAQLGIGDPAAVAKVGDTPADMLQGRAAGCGLVVGVSYGTHSRSQLALHGVPVIDRLPDLLPLIWDQAS